MQPRTTNRRRRGLVRLVVAAATVAVVAAGATGLHVVATEDAPTVAGSAATIDVAPTSAEIDWPESAAAAAFAIPGLAGAEGTFGAQGALPMASIAKLVLALVVLDARPLAPGEAGPSITMSVVDVAFLTDGQRVGASSLPIAEGDVLTQRQLLEAAMLVSAGNAATTLATWAFGSEGAYVVAATQWMADRGVEGVTVVDASGLRQENVASADALLDLMPLLDASPVLREITGLGQTSLPRIGDVQNSNRALGLAGIDSGKTGSLNASGQTSLVGATAIVGGRELRIHAVVLGVPREVDRDALVAAFVASVVDELELRPVLAQGALVGAYDAPWGEAVRLHAKGDAEVLVWPGQAIEVAVDVPDALAVGEQPLGWITITTPDGSERVRAGTHDRLLGPDLAWRLAHLGDVARWASA